MNDRLFILSKDDWSLHRKGHLDQVRHQEKIKEAIKKNIPDLITEESIIMSRGKDVVKVPIRSLDEYRFRYNFNKQKHGGQGDGDSQVGDVIAKDQQAGRPAPGDGQDSGAGEQPGVDYYEAEVSVDELEEMIFKDLELPNLEKKENEQITIDEIRFNDIRKKGLTGNIDKKRTILENLKRNARDGSPGIHNISTDDLRYKTWEEIMVPHSNAVILAMMDTSGSMGQFEKYIARSFFFWMIRFLRTRYEKVDIVFISHHTEAKVVTEEEFFTKGESGGTICSSAYRLAIELIHQQYSPSKHNIYPIHFSDGDNLTSDNNRCVKLIKELMDLSNMLGYGEVNQYNRHSSLMSVYNHLEHPKFRKAVIRERADVHKALKTMFVKQEGYHGNCRQLWLRLFSHAL
ncbi:sporulation protein YhbH [Desulfuribacillus stibiiarsenatis]|uniref:Sporulation protein YhbH n=1 Tax=Desulfuribacillus stibiiarsenatis TaxID=1390249 RepID=A0A1E5L8W0_9FIRM|nr:sporulation protein YhbH [Desulfuribacillus stibiiarsenatis]OEH86592.1 sporulation protein YhbH [Desulfuribacillus stibiiarsenatis]